jgi:hypothetical protein
MIASEYRARRVVDGAALARQDVTGSSSSAAAQRRHDQRQRYAVAFAGMCFASHFSYSGV